MTDSEEVLVHIGQCCLVPGVDEDIHTDTAWEGQIISMGCIFIHVKGLLRKNSMRTRKKTGIGGRSPRGVNTIILWGGWGITTGDRFRRSFGAHRSVLSCTRG